MNVKKEAFKQAKKEKKFNYLVFITLSILTMVYIITMIVAKEMNLFIFILPFAYFASYHFVILYKRKEEIELEIFTEQKRQKCFG